MLSLGERGNCALATGARGPTGRIKTIKQGGLVEGDHTALWAKDVPNRKKKKKKSTHPPTQEPEKDGNHHRLEVCPEPLGTTEARLG